MTVRAVIKLDGPFDLALSLRAAASFLPSTGAAIRSLRLAVPIAGRPAIVEIRQRRGAPAIIEAFTTAAIPRARLEDLALWLISGDLDLRQFYRITTAHSLMAPIARRLRGLKPIRPSSLFEMAIIAITEQQLSLAAAFHIRKRLLERFGTPIEDLYVVPSADVMATAVLSDLRACGLSQRKAEYVSDLAKSVVSGDLALEALKHQSDAEVRNRLMQCRGFGAWSVEYFLLRGLGRFDCLPSDDVGLRRTIAFCLSRRRRLSPRQLERALSRFAPFRGLAAFYLAADFRLRQQRMPETGCSSSEAGK